jgi:NADPH:quinone reductase
VGPEANGEAATLKAAVIARRRVVFTDVPDPVPAEDEILVQVKAAGLNNSDVAARFLAAEDDDPRVEGLECAGVVVDRGASATRFDIGDRVMTLTLGGGGHAELVCVPESVAMPVPDSVPWEVAGAFPEAFCTAHDALYEQCRLQPNDRLLVTGAAGGVGVAAVQLGAAKGAVVVASVRSESAHEPVATLGATVIHPDDQADHGPYDVVLEMFPEGNLRRDLETLATGGRIHVVSVVGGSEVIVDLRLLMHRRGAILGSQLKTRQPEAVAEVVRRVERKVLPMLSSKKVRVPIYASYPLDQAADAYKLFVQPGKLGKIVLLS